MLKTTHRWHSAEIFHAGQKSRVTPHRHYPAECQGRITVQQQKAWLSGAATIGGQRHPWRLTGSDGRHREGTRDAPSQASNRRRLKTPPVLDTDPVSFAMHSSTNGRSGRGSRGARVAGCFAAGSITRKPLTHAISPCGLPFEGDGRWVVMESVVVVLLYHGGSSLTKPACRRDAPRVLSPTPFSLFGLASAAVVLLPCCCCCHVCNPGEDSRSNLSAAAAAVPPADGVAAAAAPCYQARRRTPQSGCFGGTLHDG